MSFSKTLRVVFTLVVGGSLVVPITQVKASPRLDFSDYRGRYAGSWTISVGGTTVVAPVSGQVTGPANGSRMQVQFSGLLSAPGLSAQILTSFSLTRKHQVTGSAILMGFEGPSATLPARFSGKGKAFSFTLAAAPGAAIEGQPFTATFYDRLRLTKTSLTIAGQGQISTSTPTGITINITLRKKGKK